MKPLPRLASGVVHPQALQTGRRLSGYGPTRDAREARSQSRCKRSSRWSPLNRSQGTTSRSAGSQCWFSTNAVARVAAARPQGRELVLGRLPATRGGGAWWAPQTHRGTFRLTGCRSKVLVRLAALGLDTARVDASP